MSEMPMPPHQPRPRRPFPWGPLAIIVVGILFLLLAVSASFNAYFLFVVRENARGGAEEIRRLEQEAKVQRDQMTSQQRRLGLELEVQRAQLDDRERQLVLVQKQLDEAKRRQSKD